MILNKTDAIFAANYFRDYYDGFKRIDDYLRRIKMERMERIPKMLPGMSIGDEMFSDFTVDPRDMEIDVRLADARFDDYLEVTTSHAIEKSAPGRTLKMMVFEKNSGKIIGFIRVGSCVINSKPRNDFLGQPLETYNLDSMKRFNQAACMGLIIVPTQPFGYNYLGGKLLAGVCCSHKVRRMFNEKYGSNICHFETTSLYGTTKSSSQYDGMKPFLRYKGLTDSDFPPMLNDEKFDYMRKWFTERKGEPLKTNNSSVKMSIQSMMVGVIKKSLKEEDPGEYKKFVELIENAKGLTERKRVYISDYGFENTVDYILGRTDVLKKKDNFDRFELDGITQWWQKLAGKRFEKLKSEGRLRTELELWNENADKIDIIR